MLQKPQHQLIFGVLVVGLTLLAVVVLVPLAAPLILGTWVAFIARPWLKRATRFTRNRARAAAMLTAIFITLSLLPLVLIVFAAAADAVDLYKQIRGSQNDLLGALLKPEGATGKSVHLGLREAITIAQSYGERIWDIAVTLSGTAASAVVGAIIFFWSVYATLSHGATAYVWLATHSGLREDVIDRMRNAYVETGRGLLIGVCGTSAIQGAVAMATFFALGIPRALLLGFLTMILCILPGLGSALVWGPTAIALAMTGQTGKAGILTAIGILVIGTVDNLVRPFLARAAELKMSTFMLFVSMIGGIAVFGGFGLFLGPLVLRLAREALELRQEGQARPALMHMDSIDSLARSSRVGPEV